MSVNAVQLLADLQASVSIVSGVGTPAAAHPTDIPSDFITRVADGVLVRVSYSQAPTSGQQSTAAGIVQAHNGAAAAVTLTRNQAKAVAQAADALGAAVRGVALAAGDEINILREQVVGVVTATWDPANMANGAGVTSPAIAVNGGTPLTTAAFGDFADVSASYDLQGITATAYVVSAGNVVVRLQNLTGAAVNLVSGTWRVVVRRHAAMPDRTPAQIKAAVAAKIDAGGAD